MALFIFFVYIIYKNSGRISIDEILKKYPKYEIIVLVKN